MPTNLHRVEIRNGKCYCGDCGSQLTVGGYESYLHRDRKSGARGTCPHKENARA